MGNFTPIHVLRHQCERGLRNAVKPQWDIWYCVEFIACK